MQVNDADMALSSPALISCQHFKLLCSYWSQTSPVLILTEAYLQQGDTMGVLERCTSSFNVS